MAKQYPPIHLGSPGEDIGIQDLQTVRQRFKRLHQIRAQRIQDFLQPRQRIFLELLALIFDRNLPLLPGFISSGTPAGIANYSPGSQAIKAAGQFAKNFSYTPNPLQNSAIEGVFLMGSVGSIAFSKSSDMDIWLCHQSGLMPSEIDELQKKATAIESWAASLTLEVHFFLMDSEQFRLGHNTPISSESSGQTQHYLLLEEFYRTSIYIAGKSPVWWLVPPHQENNYTSYVNHLKENRFIFYDQEFIDFGGLDAVPSEEFISATLWHIYKSLHSPHKSLLKLLLMECYASEYPHTAWLCQEVKQAVHHGNYAVIDLDPYLLIYQKVEAYLQKTNSFERLALARQSFYLKIMGSSGNPMNAQTRESRQEYMANIAKNWNWPASTLADLNRQRYWDIKKATREHAIILQQLIHCYRMIMGFAGSHVNQNSQDSNDLKLIGRKLYSFLEKKPGKIEILTTRSAIHCRETELSIVESRFNERTSGWVLFLKHVQMANASDFEPIQKCQTLIEILCWLIINGLYHKQVQVHFSTISLKTTKEELHSMLSCLNQFLTANFDCKNSLEAYQTAKTMTKSLVFINLGIAGPEACENSLCVMSERSDALSYGMDRQCFVQTMDKISLSSWSEVTTGQYENIDGLFNCLTELVNNNKKPLSSNDLTIVCYTPVRAKSIILRVEAVFNTLIKLFSKQQRSRSWRYILAGGSSFYIFQTVNKILSFRKLATKDLLLKELASHQAHFSPVHFDQAVLDNSPIPFIYTLNKPQIIQVFYCQGKTHISIYIIDEKGALYTQQHQNSDLNQLLNQYSAFLEAILNRNLFESIMNLEYYEIRKNPAGVFSCKPVFLKTPFTIKQLNLRISGIASPHGINYTIYCNDQEFSSLDHGKQVFYATYQYIIQFRQSKLDYPIHITDVDLPLSAFGIDTPDQLQTIHYLNYKQKIEAKLNS
ncbi:Adenylate cyclase [Candidatus Methylobacter favarea]|uniref:Adenylate cyclase n=1 Tax=Candidatus Methylobacter favarea TaxID=2707345 RepID=A0A8S0X801_9GAMM|nr:class I adenylate cyclase [Candidatus Methylobacter favarea]CAA9890550.1 Adenylate cyclase [Candidatus Methylobacter favarea]